MGRLGPGSAALFLCLAAGAGAATGAPELTGRDLAVRVDERPRGKDLTLHAVWRLVDRAGRERVRETRSFWRDARGDGAGHRSQRLIVFDAPGEVRETAFLVWSHQDPAADDDRWIYLPALRKVRRIAGGDRGSSFLGTDFSYEDLTERAVEEDEHVVLRTEPRDGVPHHVLESVPKRDDDPCSRRVRYVDAERFTESRIEYYGRGGELEKVLVAEWQTMKGIETWKRLEMTHAKSGHRTVVEITEARYDAGLGPDAFSEAALRAGGP